MPRPQPAITSMIMSHRCLRLNERIRSSILATSMVVAGAGLLDVGLDQVAVLDHVLLARSETAQHFDELAAGATEFDLPRRVDFSVPYIDDIATLEALQRAAAHGERRLR